MADVRFQHVYKRYGDNPPVIVDLNLEMADREFLVLVGPSGCGKSTALRMIAGLEDISEGELYIGDRLVNDVAPKDRDIAMVFQNYALYPHMTVFDNMAFALKLRHTRAGEVSTRVEQAAQILGITPYRKRKPRELSAASGSGWRWGGRWYAIRGCCCWMSRSRISTRNCACRRARRSADCIRRRNDIRLRHPRSGGSDDDGRPHRRHECWRDPAIGYATGSLRHTPRICSSRALSARPRWISSR